MKLKISIGLGLVERKSTSTLTKSMMTLKKRNLVMDVVIISHLSLALKRLSNANFWLKNVVVQNKK